MCPPVPKMNSATALGALFTSSFLAATLLPGGSEIALFTILKLRSADVAPALIVATLGNTLGGMTSYLLGRIIPQARRAESLALVGRYGPPTLLLSWVPIAGDALCVAAGWLRMNPWSCTFFMAVGKLGRYAIIAALV